MRDISPTMITLSECVNASIKNGYSENFKIAGERLTTSDGKSIYKPEQISIQNFFRFEGDTDPQDSSILFLIETFDGKKGILIDAYGVYADSDYSNFLRLVDHIRKG
jgi:hypothetical protein